MKKIGFIGVGIMGKSMVRNLMKAGFDVAIYTRTKSKVEDVICEGAAWRDSVKECVADRDAVITIVGYPMASNTGMQASKASLSPPARIVRVPAFAPLSPPVTGASRA